MCLIYNNRSYLQHAEDLRKVLEQCSVEKDIVLFISERKTGLEKPSK